MAGAALPTRFRSRLTAAFVLVASIASGALALGSYLTVSRYRNHVFREHATEAAQLALLSSPREISLEVFEDILGEFQRRAGFETVAVVGDVTFSSSSRLGTANIPLSLRAGLPSGATRQQTLTVEGEPFLVAAGKPRASEVALYLFFSRDELEESLRFLRNVLSGGWLVAVAAAAAFGDYVARRTLRPVRAAAGAATDLAEGLLETRMHPQGDEFDAWSDSFNRMAEALEHKIKELSDAAERERRFTADVAHDLRTPLTGMSSAASLLEDELPQLPLAARRITQLLIADVRRLETLVLDLLELAHHDVGRETAHLEPLSIRESLQAAVRSWHGDSAVVPITDGEDAWVLADRARFRSVVTNLLSNAFRHGGGVVEVAIRPDADSMAIDVLDRGPGLSSRDLDSVFDRFYKGDPARTGTGSGLGLAIAWENARLQGGILEAANREGGGARFTFRLARATRGESGELAT